MYAIMGITGRVGTPFGTDRNVGQALAPGYTLGVRASFEVLSWAPEGVRRVP